MQPIEANAPETRSADIVAGNVEQLKVLFPEAFTEDKVDFEVLKQLLGETIEEREEKYGLNWHGKRRARQLALTPSTGTLRPCPEDSVDWDSTQNLMIEGDNLEVLKLLQKSYAGKVKLIYIDPPYNTGKDFVYPDNFQDNIKNYLELTGQVEGGRKISSNTEASGRFHTDWLNMMYPRLKLARNLLREDGAIFVSLDDGEVAHLRTMLDEIFGTENFVANVIWEKKFAPQNDEKYFSERHDFVVVFAKNKAAWNRNLLPRGGDALARYKNPDNDTRGPWASSDLLRIEHRDNCVYSITSPTGVKWTPEPGTSWRHPEEEMQELIRTGQVWFGTDGASKPRRKRYLSEVSEGVVPETMWFHKDCGHNQEATQETKALFSDIGVPFSNPKPTRLIQRMLAIATSATEGDVVLDFFAGSGTTGHAVIAQNAGDSGNRRSILVQLPETVDPAIKEQKFAADCCDLLGKPRTIAELTKERLRRAAAKIKGEVTENTPQLSLTPALSQREKGLDLGFRVFKLDSSNIRSWEPDRDKLAESLFDATEHLKADRAENDVLFELLLKLGLDLTVPIDTRAIAGKTVHSIGAGVLLVCLTDKITTAEVEALALGIAAWHKEQAPAGEAQVVFRDSAFENDVAKTNCAAILSQHGLTNVRSL
jgi:adenine-specific DNA-methyltransferase